MEESKAKEAGVAYFDVALTEQESRRFIPDRTPEQAGSPSPTSPQCTHSTLTTPTHQAPPPYGVEYVRGNLPIVLTVPHGGYIAPPSIPSRTKGCLEHDDCSQELARAIYAHMVAHVNAETAGSPLYYPHLVVLHLNRLKVDVNRPLDGAVDDHNLDTKAVAAHRAYHGYIEEALRWSVSQWGFAHLFDIHGQSHRHVMEFGFLLSTDHLKSSDEQLDDTAQGFLPKSSLSGMERYHSQINADGPGLGAILQDHGFDSVPSPKYPNPSQTPPFRADMAYFWGAWTTRHYAQAYQQERDHVGGREWLEFVSTTQVEPTHDIRCDLPTRTAFARALAQTFVAFVARNYHCEMTTQ